MDYSQNFFYGASPEIHRRAKELRRTLTTAETKLWELLKNKNLTSLKFRRQHPIGPYIADFYCHSLRLVIELDGGVHDTIDQIERDKGREFELRNLGLRIIRFQNDEVLSNLDQVRKVIEAFGANPDYFTPP
ncbi:endonuclease domain-containing protein [Algoriphagus sp. A40]|uniref:endonuclease domain-containing protein n=1 Tax=Algoriphagus sp. A40 TaxID=1945863 RepID=UPI0009850DC0|nr:endonuclease domain-containing protein [Algoriphagus sp. A40]OOG72282.1 hypothetical protein B0E43_15355 [Algoriphagus sp. A40]